MDGKKLAQLLDLSNAYRSDDVASENFYRALSRLAANNIHRYPEFERYLNYVFLSHRIDSEKLPQELQQQEALTYARLTRTDTERRLIRQSNELNLAKKLIAFTLTKEEWNAYKLNAGDTSLKPFESFYQEAEARDKAMAKNTLSAISRQLLANGQQMTADSSYVLITGGFHSAGIDRQLAEAGFTVVSFVPKITKLDSENGSTYLSAFAREKTPLEKILGGEKLFLAAPRFPVETQVELTVDYVGWEKSLESGLKRCAIVFKPRFTAGNVGRTNVRNICFASNTKSKWNVPRDSTRPSEPQLTWPNWDQFTNMFHAWWRGLREWIRSLFQRRKQARPTGDIFEWQRLDSDNIDSFMRLQPSEIDSWMHHRHWDKQEALQKLTEGGHIGLLLREQGEDVGYAIFHREDNGQSIYA